MDWSSLITIGRLAALAWVLVMLGRLLRTARIYLSWSAFIFLGLAGLAFPVLCVLELRLLGTPGSDVARQGVEALFFIGVAGGLVEHVRADRRRHRDSRRLLEQWRQASSLSRQRAGELEVLAAITARLVASLDLSHVLQSVVDHALRLAAADSVTVYLVDQASGAVRDHGVSAVAGQAGAPAALAPRTTGLIVTVARSGVPAFIENGAEQPSLQDAARPLVGAIASLPLRLNGTVVGVLNVAYRRPRTFDDDLRRMLIALADIAALAIHNAAQHERLARLAVTDDLTGLPNRRRFAEALRAEAQRARRYGRALALLMLDVDGLKAINDRHGHAAGDAVLRGVGQVLRANTRDTDLPTRLSGDEFAVILPETEPEAALLIAERIRTGVADLQVPAEGALVTASVSVGVASAEGSALPEVPRFMRLADEALYRAKASGRNNIAVSPGPRAHDAASRVLPTR
jgi:diguanylate cyclase (GGDEF)-like protein